jgi:uncharacterized protein with FMN-binding domain
MGKAIPAAIITVVGLGALAAFKSSPGLPASKSASAAPSSSTPATAPPRSRTASPTVPTTVPSATAPRTTTPTTAAATRTVAGDPVDNQYGTVQVQVTLRGNTITDVTELQMPSDRQRSAEISSIAGPELRQEALQAQSAQIDLLSGATFTSESYAQSLQSALDKAHG